MDVTAEQSGSTAFAGMGVAPKADFWIGPGKPSFPPVHIAFTAKSREEVRKFYAAAGPPGLRPHYHSNYYGAFVLDLDGNNIEAVCHLPE
jgi:hypothetical protein